MKTTNGTPATTETPREQYLSECLTERREVLDKTRAEYFKLEQKCDALTAKAAALDALVEAATDALRQAETPYIVEHVYRANMIDKLKDALSAAKAAQVSK